METPDKPSYRFGAFRLNPAGRLLVRGRERLDLPPRAFDTLVMLVGEKGNLIEKERLMRAIWPDTAVEENNLSQAVYLLRKTLRDGEDGARYIETVPKQGYRFIARVHEIAAWEDEIEDSLADDKGAAKADARASQENGKDSKPALQLAAPAAAEPRTEQSNRVRWGWAGLAGLLLLLGAFQAIKWRGERQNRAQLEAIRSIAVLPLQNLSNDPDQEYFADGMTDELITDLAQVRELRVVSKTSVMQYKGAHRPLPQIGRELGVDAVVEGSVMGSGNRVRITAQLIRTATDSHLWAKSYEGEFKDSLSLQAQVAEAITEEVRLNLTLSERSRLSRPHRVKPEAYEAYLRGRFSWNRRDQTGFERAVEYFHQALEKDPDIAPAYAGLADCYILMNLNWPDPLKLRQAKEAARKAISLDDESAEAHTSLAAVRVFLDWDWKGAEDEFKRALELNPNYAPAHHWYGNILLGPLGRHEEALAELKRAQQLDPFSLIINTDLGYGLYLARRYDEAFNQYQKVLAMDSGFVAARHDLAEYYLQTGARDKWVRYCLAVSDPEEARRMRDLYASGGDRAVLQELARHATATRYWFGAALDYTALGKHKQALASLEKAVDAREPGLVYLKVDPWWDSLRGDVDFQSLERRMGLE